LAGPVDPAIKAFLHALDYQIVMPIVPDQLPGDTNVCVEKLRVSSLFPGLPDAMS
jgi:hypothetical protein